MPIQHWLNCLRDAKAKLAVAGLMFVANASYAGDHSNDFKNLYDQLLTWSTGTLGKSIAIVFLLCGLCAGVLRGNLSAAIIAVAAALCLVVAPSVIESIFAGVGVGG